MRAVSVCSERPTSAEELAARIGISVANASYHLRRLEQEGYLRVAFKKPARSKLKYFYEAIREAIAVDEEFAQMTFGAQQEFSDGLLQELSLRYEKARQAKTLDGRFAPLLRLSHLKLDEQGWLELTKELLAAFQEVRDLEVESIIRCRRSGETAIPGTCVLAGFGSPPGRPPFGKKPVMEDFLDRANRALRAGTLNARSDNHLTWLPLELDELGWRELEDIGDRVCRCALEIQGRSSKRRRQSNVEVIPTTFAVAFFESPPEEGVERGAGELDPSGVR
jgi:DNA-binding MarR family transcriptional regulator